MNERPVNTWEFNPSDILSSKRKVQGIFHQPIVDKDGEIIMPNGMRESIPNFMHFPALHDFHKERPVGLATKVLELPGGRFYFEGVIKSTPDCDDVWEKIKSKNYDQVSIFGKRTKYNNQCALPQNMRSGPCVTDGVRLDSISVCDENARNPQTSLEVKKARVIFDADAIVPSNSANNAAGPASLRTISKAMALPSVEKAETVGESNLMHESTDYAKEEDFEKGNATLKCNCPKQEANTISKVEKADGDDYDEDRPTTKHKGPHTAGSYGEKWPTKKAPRSRYDPGSERAEPRTYPPKTGSRGRTGERKEHPKPSEIPKQYSSTKKNPPKEYSPKERRESLEHIHDTRMHHALSHTPMPRPQQDVPEHAKEAVENYKRIKYRAEMKEAEGKKTNAGKPISSIRAHRPGRGEEHMSSPYQEKPRAIAREVAESSSSRHRTEGDKSTPYDNDHGGLRGYLRDRMEQKKVKKADEMEEPIEKGKRPIVTEEPLDRTPSPTSKQRGDIGEIPVRRKQSQRDAVKQAPAGYKRMEKAGDEEEVEKGSYVKERREGEHETGVGKESTEGMHKRIPSRRENRVPNGGFRKADDEAAEDAQEEMYEDDDYDHVKHSDSEGKWNKNKDPNGTVKMSKAQDNGKPEEDEEEEDDEEEDEDVEKGTVRDFVHHKEGSRKGMQQTRKHPLSHSTNTRTQQKRGDTDYEIRGNQRDAGLREVSPGHGNRKESNAHYRMNVSHHNEKSMELLSRDSNINSRVKKGDEDASSELFDPSTVTKGEMMDEHETTEDVEYVTKALVPIEEIDTIVKARTEEISKAYVSQIEEIKKAYDERLGDMQSRLDKMENETIRKGGSVVVIPELMKEDIGSMSNADAIARMQGGR